MGWSLSTPTLIPLAATCPTLFSDSAVRASDKVVGYHRVFNQELCAKGATTPPVLLPNCLASNRANYDRPLLLLSPSVTPANFFDPRDNFFFFTVFCATFWL